MPGGGQPTRPIAETSIPEFAEIRRRSRVIDWASADFSWDEDSVTRWRALALFGGLTLLVGLFFSFASEGGAPMVGLGFFPFVAAILVAAARGDEYVWALLGAGVLTEVIGFSSYQDGVFGTWPAARFQGMVPMDPGASIEMALLLGGIALLILGMVRSVQISNRLEAG